MGLSSGGKGSDILCLCVGGGRRSRIHRTTLIFQKNDDGVRPSDFFPNASRNTFVYF